METLRLGASEVLEMEPEDLQILVIGKPGVNVVDVMLYDPMPGGSGLLDQLLERWADVVRGLMARTESHAVNTPPGQYPLILLLLHYVVECFAGLGVFGIERERLAELIRRFLEFVLSSQEGAHFVMRAGGFG